MSTFDMQSMVWQIARAYLEDAVSLDASAKNKILGAIRARDLISLADARMKWSDLIYDYQSFKELTQLEAFFKKASCFSDSDRCEAAARTSFEQGETRCRITNKRLDHYYVERHRLDADLNLYMSKMETFVKRVLGSFPKFIEQLPDLVRITSGASATLSRRRASPQMKLRGNVVCTPRCVPYVKAMYSYYGYKCSPKTILWNRVTMVPKSWKTHRTIACEPDGNIPFQLAFDSFCKSRLKRVAKIDLSDQERNQELSRQGSLDGSLATIDLAAASDSLSWNLVCWLLPDDWFKYVDDLRAPFYKLDDRLRKYEKFSSMGNGTTFPLETLIFAAACHAVGSERYSVYGDDIIIETELVPAVMRVLRFIGFVPNHEKSFSDGPFRESCGANWYNGLDVTPYYIRDVKPERAPDRAFLVNELVRIGMPFGHLWSLCRKWQVGLVKVPLSEDPTHGIFVDYPTLHSLRLIRHTKKFGGVSYKRYTSKTKTKPLYNSRASALWHFLSARGRDADVVVNCTAKVMVRCFPGLLQDKHVETSSVPTGMHSKFEASWAPLINVCITPTYVYSWSDFISG